MGEILSNKNGVQQIFHYDDATDQVTVETKQDAQSIIDYNKEKRNHISQSGQEDLHYARIPKALLMKWDIEDGIDTNTEEGMVRLFQKLNSPEYSFLKTTNQKHIIKGS